VLQKEAHAFNQLLRVSETTPPGAAHNSAMLEANKDFYAFLPGALDLKGGSYEASKAFYEQVTQLPIGERRKLLDLTKAENEEIHGHNAKMPLMVLDMGSDAFINSLDFHMGPMEYTFHYLGMCAEIPDFDQSNPTAGQRSWGFDLPTLNLRR
jgi:hypothetical protein